MDSSKKGVESPKVPGELGEVHIPSDAAPTVVPPQRGAFIVFEGLDRSGKTTQVSRLKTALEAAGKPVKQLRFPDRSTVIGKMIDQYLQSEADHEDHVIHLLFSANRWELAKEIEDTIVSGTTIICDRYYYSGIVYSAAKNNPLLTLNWAREPEVGLPRPDLVIFLDLSPEDAEKRGGYGEERYEKKAMQVKVREMFLGLTKSHGLSKKIKDRNTEESEDIVWVNAGRTTEVVQNQVWEIVRSKDIGVNSLRRVGGVET